MDDPEALRQAAVELRRQGLSTTQIARELGIRRSSTLSGWLVGTPPPDWTKRPRAKDAERERARAMRQDGKSYAEIAAELGVSKSSVSLWVRDLPHPTRSHEGEAARHAGAQRYYARRRRSTFIERQNEKLRWANELGPLSDRELMIAGAVAYWAEGSKAKPYRPQERTTFVNSDADMIRLWLAWLSAVGVGRDRCRFQLQIHESADVHGALEYWSSVVGVPVERFQRVVLKRHNPLTNRKNTGERYVGCLSVRVLGAAALYRRIEGVWWAVAAAGGTEPRLPPAPAETV